MSKSIKASKTVKGKVELVVDLTGWTQINLPTKDIKKVGKGRYEVVKKVNK